MSFLAVPTVNLQEIIKMKTNHYDALSYTRNHAISEREMAAFINFLPKIAITDIFIKILTYRSHAYKIIAIAFFEFLYYGFQEI